MYSEFGAKIKKISAVAKDTFEIKFSHDNIKFSFTPGQYIWVVLPKLHFPDERGERRAFSIISSDQEKNNFAILFRASNSGYKKTLVAASPGDRVKIVGSFGSSYTLEDSSKHIVMLAGGVGIAPFLSILRSSIDAEKKYFLININSSNNKVIYLEELQKLASSKKIDFTNHVADLKTLRLPKGIDYLHDTFYICGPLGMVDYVFKKLIAKNVPAHHMRFEQYYPTPEGNLTEEDFKKIPEDSNILLQAIHESKNHVVVTDANGLVIFANATAEKNTGFSFSEMRGNTPRLWGGLMSPKFYQGFWLRKKSKNGFDGEIINRKKTDRHIRLLLISPK